MNEKIDKEAEALDQYLRRSALGKTDHRALPAENGHPQDPHLPLDEAHLAVELKKLSQRIQPDREFEAALEVRLLQGAHRRSRYPKKQLPTGRLALYIGLAALLVVGLVWVLANLMPNSAPAPASTQDVLQPATPTPTELPASPEATRDLRLAATDSPSQPGDGRVYALVIQPDIDFVLEAGFPSAPSEVALYRQQPWEPLTIEAARSAATQLGLAGSIYEYPFGPPGAESYLVWDRMQELIFYGSLRSFDFQAGNPALIERPTCEPPCQAAGSEGTLLGFLTQHQLLDFQAETRLSPTRPQVEQLVQLLDGIPLLYRPGEYQGEALVGSQGEVLKLDYKPARVEAVGTFPILSAEQAWLRAADFDATLGAEITSRSSPLFQPVTWLRTYPPETQVELFGSLQVFEPAEPGASPLLLFDNYPLSGNIQGMADAARDNAFLQLWGQFQTDEGLGLSLHVDGWQRSAFPSQVLAGTVVRRSGQAFLQTDGRELLLPDLPADVPEGQPLTASGVIIEGDQPALAWSSLSLGVGGGGGGGGSGFFEPNPEGNPAMLTALPPTAAPSSLVGKRAEALSGRPLVFIHQFDDGSAQVEVFFYPDPGQIEAQETTLVLEGEGLAAIEGLHNLPVRLWGVFEEAKKGNPVVNVERIEPIYPDLSLQAWLGRLDQAPGEAGEAALLFTSQDGEQYLLALSLEDLASQGLELTYGDPVVVEGYVKPGETILDYLVIQSYAVSLAQGMQDLSGYTAQSINPIVIQETGTAGAARRATVTSIELAYYTQDLRFSAPPAGSELPYIQPVWRFSGAYEDGSSFEILIQALSPEYLNLP